MQPASSHLFPTNGVSTGRDGAVTTLVAVISTRAVPTERRLAQPQVVSELPTFGELAEEWLKLRTNSGKRPLRPRTVIDYRRALDLVLLPRFGNQRVDAIDADAIALLIGDLESQGLHAIDPRRPKRPLLEPTISNHLKPLQGVMKLAVRRRVVRENPFLHLTDEDRAATRRRAPSHVWSDEEISGLLAAAQQLARKATSQYDYTPLLRVAARLGLRLGEVLGLQWQDFDESGRSLHVRRQWLVTGSYGPPKTDAGVRSIPLPNDLRRELVMLRAAAKHAEDSHPIFASRRGTPLHHRNVAQRGFERAASEAGIEGVTFHDLRHAAASRLIASGVDPVTVAGVLGHGDPHITLRVYAHLFNRDERDETVRRALAV